MESRILCSRPDGTVTGASDLPSPPGDEVWVWMDVIVEDGETDDLLAITTGLQLDGVSVRDAVDDDDLPKVDDFGHHLLVVLHGLRDDRVETYEVDCFITDRHLITVHDAPSPAIDALWSWLVQTPELAAGTVDELVARLADVLTRRLLSVLEAFDDEVDRLIDAALAADPELLVNWMAIRTDVATVRRVVHPQRETLDLLRHSSSPLVTEAGRRRFADVFDVAARTAAGLDAARSALAEILDAYRGAEARQATDVTKVLTIYAAIMLPLSLIAGFFGMNFRNLPGAGNDSGWVIVAVAMFAVAVLSLGVFVALGWMRRPSGREAGAALGLGLSEAARVPVQIVGAAYEISTIPLRSAITRATRDPSRGTK
jgi:magnesium transporter